MKMISLVFRDDLVTVGLSLRSGIATSPVDTAQLWNTTADLFRFIQRWADETRADDWELFLVDLSFIQFLCRRIEAETGRLPEVFLEEHENTLVTTLNGWEEGQVVIGMSRLKTVDNPEKRACLEGWRKACNAEGLLLTIRMKKDLSSAAAYFLAKHDPGLQIGHPNHTGVRSGRSHQRQTWAAQPPGQDPVSAWGQVRREHARVASQRCDRAHAASWAAVA